MTSTDQEFIQDIVYARQEWQDLERLTTYDEERLKIVNYKLWKTWKDYQYALETAEKHFSLDSNY